MWGNPMLVSLGVKISIETYCLSILEYPNLWSFGVAPQYPRSGETSNLLWYAHHREDYLFDVGWIENQLDLESTPM